MIRMGPLNSGDRQCLEESERKDDRLNQSTNDGGDCRTALATPGLLIINSKLFSFLHLNLSVNYQPSMI